MRAPVHLRGPFMAKLWLIFALAIIAVQMVYVLNLVTGNYYSVEEPEVTIRETPKKSESFSETAETKRFDDKAEVEKDSDRENEIDNNNLALKPDAGAVEPEQRLNLPNPVVPPGNSDQDNPILKNENNSGQEKNAAMADNSQLFNFLHGAVAQVFDGASSGGSGMANPLSQINQLMPMMALLPALTGGSAGGLGSVNWEKYMPMLERAERFARYCTTTFKATFIEMKQKHPQKAKEPTFVSAVSMKGFFRIFSNEDYQEEFLELVDGGFGLLEQLGMTDHFIELVSGRMFEKIIGEGGGAGGTDLLSAGGAGLAAIFSRSDKDKSTTTVATTTKASEEEEEDEGEDEEEKTPVVSNEHFESILETYDLMLREEETANETTAKMELSGRMFLQTWYEAIRRYAKEKGKIQPKPLTSDSFVKFLESVEVPFSNILDYAYPIKNEELCKSKPSLLVVVISKNQNVALRNAIRQTWAGEAIKKATPFAKVLFVLSDRDEDRMIVEEEAKSHGDIITVDVPQTYEYATRKALVALDWTVHYCEGSGYVFKMTDQMYLNISNLQKEMKLQPSATLMGNLVSKDPVQRVPLKLDYLFYDEYPYDKFTPYLKGFGFLMSFEVAKNAIGIAKDFPLLRADDYPITGLLPEKLKVTPYGLKEHPVTPLTDAPWEDTKTMSKMICDKKTSSMFGSRLSAPQMLFIQATLANCA